MKENPSGRQGGFESMEHNNSKGTFVTHQSETTPAGMAKDYNAVHQMKMEGMDEAYGMAGRKGCDKMYDQVESQFRSYNWA